MAAFSTLSLVSAQSRDVERVPAVKLEVAPLTPHPKVGKPILVQITVTVTSSENISWTAERYDTGYKDFRFKLTTAGKPVPTTLYYRKVTVTPNPDDPPMSFDGASIVFTIAPGQVFRYQLDIAKLYDIRSAGEYALTVSRLEETSGAMVKADTTFRVEQ